MGGTSSQLYEEEKTNWVVDHKLGVDQALRETQLPLLAKFQNDLKLCFRKCRLHGFEYFHYFVTDGKWTMEFGGGGISNMTVLVHANPYATYITCKEFSISGEVMQRMRNVCGASAYSLCLRNCEHLANYVHSGTWYSLQMIGDSPIKKALITHMMQQQAALVNTLPECLKDLNPSDEMPQLYNYPSSMETQPVKFVRRLQALTKNDADAINIVVLGPTGAGKSTIINLLFNQKVCKSANSAYSVTRHMDILSGTFDRNYYDEREHRTYKQKQAIRIIDSLGFCDTVIGPEEVLKIVKNYIQSNVLYIDKVVILCSGRIENGQACAIKDLMTWLDYTNHKADFVFVYNKAEDLTEPQRLQRIGEMGEILNFDPRYSFLFPTSSGSKQVRFSIATGFPARAPYEEVHQDLVSLYDAVLSFRGDTKRMRVDESWCSIL